MNWKNTDLGYGLAAILLHWLSAVAILGLFGLGYWMTGLTYYDAWYTRAPALHKGVGVLLALAMLGRLAWRAADRRPPDEPSLGRLERWLAHAAHALLYLLTFAVLISGYLISTAEGQPVDVFGLFQVPALVQDLPNQADLAGKVHWYLALGLVGLSGLHALAALKHHFVDRDRTLLKMLGRGHR